jgi:hypothetical protein
VAFAVPAGDGDVAAADALPRRVLEAELVEPKPSEAARTEVPAGTTFRDDVGDRDRLARPSFSLRPIARSSIVPKRWVRTRDARRRVFLPTPQRMGYRERLFAWLSDAGGGS